jgi:hypothetical protein
VYEEQTNKTHSQPPPEYSQQPQYGFQGQQPQYGFIHPQGPPIINVTQPVVMEHPREYFSLIYVSGP